MPLDQLDLGHIAYLGRRVGACCGCSRRINHALCRLLLSYSLCIAISSTAQWCVALCGRGGRRGRGRGVGMIITLRSRRKMTAEPCSGGEAFDVADALFNLFGR